jgi:hypothetical protein
MKRQVRKIPPPAPEPKDVEVIVTPARMTVLWPYPETFQQALFRGMRLPAKHGEVLRGYTTTAFAVSSRPDRPLVLVLHPPGLLLDGEVLVNAVIRDLLDGDAGK